MYRLSIYSLVSLSAFCSELPPRRLLPGDDAFPLLVAHLVEAGAYQVVLVGEHFVEGAFRDSQRLRDLIDPDGTNAVPGDEFPAWRG